MSSCWFDSNRRARMNQTVSQIIDLALGYVRANASKNYRLEQRYLAELRRVCSAVDAQEIAKMKAVNE